VAEQRSYWGEIGRSPVLDDIVQYLQTVCEENINEFLGHQETANLLRGIDQPEARAIAETSTALTGLVFVLRSLLKHRISIAEIAAIATQYLERYRSGADPGAIAQELVTMREKHTDAS
jgi:flagellar biosynthesis component FlhA